ncbi:type VI secretion system ATPase TssH [uncultured Azohydromonas sp.]|jgi:type VI secretion ATPase, ClpV1 family|uniref:type VI secretion system ATPase TssH n=1 Tax=uncultured Azohydromonas sp. TaxID=487342 RepID=UPI00260F5DFF|nr:type VI secretion system ATPase TssH [uncultured Azohydromonas sp.]
MSHRITQLVSKLNDTCRHAAARAAALAMARGHHEVDIEHLLLALLEGAGSDFTGLCRRFRVDAAQLRAELEQELATLPAGHEQMPVFSLRLRTLFEQGWSLAARDTHDTRIRSVHLLQALLTQPALSHVTRRASPQFARIPAEALTHGVDELTLGSAEAPGSAMATMQAPTGGAMVAPASKALEPSALEQYTLDLTQHARDGGIDPVISRDAEIRQLMDILLRRRQNNPLLIGEAGVGKTTVVAGLALRIAAGEVPRELCGVAIRALDLELLQAGAGIPGELERRLRRLIAEVQGSAHPVVLFIDEAHTLLGTGAAEVLKPALARGELRTIAAATWSEYRRHVGKDATLARRFQVVKVEEPSPALAVAMLRGLAPRMERHFGLRIRDDAITEAVRLSTRHLGERQLPGQAVSVLDSACARVALSQSTVPAAIEAQRRQIERLEAEAASLRREDALSEAQARRLRTLQAERGVAQARLDALCARFEAERALVQELKTLHATLSDPQALSWRTAQRLLSGRAALAELQAQSGLVPLEVDANAVAAVVADRAGIPPTRLLQDEIQTMVKLETLLAQRVIAQPQALSAIAQRLRGNRAGLQALNQPRGVFLLVGPGGVGKSETARALAELLCGSERRLVTLRMDDYREIHTLDVPQDTPPRWRGSGVVTEAVRRHPHSVVLLDEAEQAPPEVLALLHQVLDQGVLQDAEGRPVDFRHCLLLLSSQLDAELVRQACAVAGADTTRLAKALRPPLARRFSPALLERLTLVPYLPLDATALQAIVRLKLDRLAMRVAARHQAPLHYDDAVVAAIQARCSGTAPGAHPIDQFLEATLLPAIAEQVLQRMAGGRPPQGIHISIGAATGQASALHGR